MANVSALKLIEDFLAVLGPQSHRKHFRNGLEKHPKASKNIVSECILKSEIAKIFSPAAGYPNSDSAFGLG